MNLIEIFFESTETVSMKVENQLLNLVAQLNWWRQKEAQQERDTEKKINAYKNGLSIENAYKEALESVTLEELYVHHEMINSFRSFDMHITNYVADEIASRTEEDHEAAAKVLHSF